MSWTLKPAKWEEHYVEITLRISLVLASICFGVFSLKSLLQPVQGWPVWRLLLLFMVSVGGACFTHIRGYAADYSNQIYMIGFGYSAFSFACFFAKALLEPTKRIYEPYESLFGLGLSLICMGVYWQFFRKKKR